MTNTVYIYSQFTNLIKEDVDVDVNEVPLSNTRAICEKQLTALHAVHMFDLFNRYVLVLLTKMRSETKTVPLT